MSTSSNNSNDLNKRIIEILEVMMHYYEVSIDKKDKEADRKYKFKALAYLKAIRSLKPLLLDETSKHINLKEILKEDYKDYHKNPIKFVGKRIRQHILDILTTGTCKEYEDIINLKPKSEILKNKTEKLYELNKLDELSQLNKIFGVGKVRANKLWELGIKTPQQLREYINDNKLHENILNYQQTIGLKYYEDLLLPIPRNETEEIVHKIQSTVDNLLLIHNNNKNNKNNQCHIKCEAVGSYRRGVETSNDIDILIYPISNNNNNNNNNKNNKNNKIINNNVNECLWILDPLIEILANENFLVDHLSFPTESILNIRTHHDDHPAVFETESETESEIDYESDIEFALPKNKKIRIQKRLDEILPIINDNEHEYKTGLNYMGICRLNKNSVHRHIDIKVVPYNEIPFALLYFTGSNEFNRGMRHHANKLGYLLNQKGLFHLEKDENHKHIGHGKIQITPDDGQVRSLEEHDIFSMLNLPYREPNQRNYW